MIFPLKRLSELLLIRLLDKDGRILRVCLRHKPLGENLAGLKTLFFSPVPPLFFFFLFSPSVAQVGTFKRFLIIFYPTDEDLSSCAPHTLGIMYFRWFIVNLAAINFLTVVFSYFKRFLLYDHK